MSPAGWAPLPTLGVISWIPENDMPAKDRFHDAVKNALVRDGYNEDTEEVTRWIP